MNTKVKEDTINDIERKIYNDPLARIAERDNSRLRPQQVGAGLAPMSQDITAAGSASYMPSPSSTISNSMVQGQDPTQMFAGEPLPSFLQEGGDDWWQSDLDMDTLTQAMRSHNDLFEIGH
jgi:hypothetical protein